MRRLASRFLPFAILGYVLVSGAARIAEVRTEAQANPTLPTFVVDSAWPKVPSQWRLGDASSFAVDAQDRIWLLHRPRTLTGEAASKAAPPVMVFDAAGNYLMSWGGDAPGREWPQREHGIHVDSRGFVWVGGNNCPGNGISNLQPVADDQLLKLAPDGKLVLQIGKSNQSKGNADTANVHRAADAFVHAPTNEVFVADGYGNHRVIVFDATTGAFKRMWGAFGDRPVDDDHCEVVTPKTVEDPGPRNFSIVHALRVSRDGIVYVADRENRRVQAFTLEGKFLKQLVKADTPFARNLALSPDRDQRYLYVGNGDEIAIVDRRTLTLAGSIKPAGLRNGGHQIATDSKGNLYVAQTGSGLQKLTLTSQAGR
jgi:DNA-binding beta-propeller fold protein YncE